ncbi:EamA family transporter RarD [Carbonactinospora thermoautotrophica]|uniref:Putative integral membrane protein n=1 Tax=Carbonactinospora thermoautotrophica TaxID=1469144 RepID=A0A132MY90_9ACTN|nr:EamA family transporter RarD [Carbonactinospora thermoautotrophica]KWX02784.1 putative integral membrane protein [Carbonactinospora thermoautotrophica]MCX9190604.1 EamA family transporter RarD [Carbonactinospora thermoautotrophica]
MSRERTGLLFGIAAYGIWGLFPLYWPLLEPADAVEILAHRMVWALVTVLVMLAVLRHWSWLRTLRRTPGVLVRLALAGLTIGANWGTYIWAVNNAHVVEASLGYCVNPLTLVLLGVLVFRERLRRAQWAALGIGVVAVVIFSAGAGAPPWIALALAFTFSAYGLLKKQANTGTLEALTVETAVLLPVAAGYIAWLEATGRATVGHVSGWHTLLIASSGLVTAVPLLCFGAAATRIGLAQLGFLQYVTPVTQLAIGVLVYGEPMPPYKIVGFLLVAVALAVLATDGLRAARRVPRRPAEDTEPLPAEMG